MRNFKYLSTAALLLMMMLLSVAPAFCESAILQKGDTDATAPAQPTEGPGGTGYRHADVSVFHAGAGAKEYWIYEPATPAPDNAPVIVFLHGWGAMFPQSYGAWIRHLARSGNIVIFPRYQESFMAKPPEMYRNAIDTVKTALAELNNSGHVAPELDRVAAVGHSFGGVMAANFAADWSAERLPKIRAFMSVQPGDGENVKKQKFVPKDIPSIMADYSKITPDTLFVAMAGADDNLVADVAAIKIFSRAKNVPEKNKNYIRVDSDFHGTPALLSDHMQPLCVDDDLSGVMKPKGAGESGLLYRPGESPRSKMKPKDAKREGYEPDAYDYYPIWRTFDALASCAFNGSMCELAIGETETISTSGKWSDGAPLKPLVVLHPAEKVVEK